MGTPYIGEIRMFGGNFAPLGWALCQGQLLAISGNEALFNLIGTTYGGDGQNTFGLPNLQSRAPIHQGQGPGLSNYVIGGTGGVENVTLTTTQLPGHSHAAQANSIGTGGTSSSPAGNYWAGSTSNDAVYKSGANATNSTMNAGAISPVGGNQSHSNIQPYLAINFIIALEGVYPSPTTTLMAAAAPTLEGGSAPENTDAVEAGNADDAGETVIIEELVVEEEL